LSVPPADSRRAFFGRALVLAGFVAAAALVVALRVPTCPTALLLGVPCPGCGLTRATLLLFSGDIVGALRMHPLVPILLPAFVIPIGYAAYEYVRGPRRDARSPWQARWVTPTAIVLGVLMFGVWGLRFAGYFGGPVPPGRTGELRAKLGLGAVTR
jgi:hypothetical protein